MPELCVRARPEPKINIEMVSDWIDFYYYNIFVAFNKIGVGNQEKKEKKYNRQVFDEDGSRIALSLNVSSLNRKARNLLKIRGVSCERALILYYLIRQYVCQIIYFPHSVYLFFITRFFTAQKQDR